MIEVTDFHKKVQRIAAIEIGIARFVACKAIFESGYDEKYKLLQSACNLIDDAETWLKIIERHFPRKTFYVNWESLFLERSQNKEIERVIHEGISSLASSAEKISQQIQEEADRNIIYGFICGKLKASYQVFSEVRSLFSNILNAQDSRYEDFDIIQISTKRSSFEKTINGPKKLGLPKFYEIGESVLELEQPVFTDKIDEVTEYLWHRCARESAASALCSLMAFEYDKLPFEFYYDILHQSYDEARHASFYWKECIKLFPIVLAQSKNKVIVEQIIQFQKYGSGLKLPKEAVFYEMFWNTNLVERFVFMHIDTEAAGIVKFKDRIRWAEQNRLSALSIGLKVDEYDEKFHAKLGGKWLKYIIPDPVERKSEIEKIRLLRGFYILTSVAANDKKSSISDFLRASYPQLA